MGQPAARITDMHTCPMVTPGLPPIPHVGGPIIGPCSPNVITGGLLQARITDQCICVGPPDVIVKASMTVLVNNLNAARIGDMTAHGGVIVTGFPTVLIGDQALGGGGAAMGGGTGADPAELVSSAPGMTLPGDQAKVLTEAAKTGTPFCEVCARAAASEAIAKAHEAAAAAQAAALAAKQSFDPTRALDGLAEKLESTVPPNVLAERKALAQKYFEDQLGLEPQQATQLMKGIDFSKPVELADIPPPDVLYQYVRKGSDKVGNWFSPVLAEARALGLNPDPMIRELKQFKAPSTQVLKSTAAAVVDYWTNKGVPVPTPGGGTQMVVPKHVVNAVKAL